MITVLDQWKHGIVSDMALLNTLKNTWNVSLTFHYNTEGDSFTKVAVNSCDLLTIQEYTECMIKSLQFDTENPFGTCREYCIRRSPDNKYATLCLFRYIKRETITYIKWLELPTSYEYTHSIYYWNYMLTPSV